MIIVSFGIWVAALLLIAWGIDRVYASLFGGKAYRFFMFPGAVVHHVSKAVACVLTGAPIKTVKFIDPKESTVQHSEPKLPAVGHVLIALAPLVACGAMLFVVPLLMEQPLHVGPPLPQLVDFSVDSGATWAKSFIDVFTSMVKYFGSAQYTIALVALCYLGLVFSVAVGMDAKAMKYAFLGVIALTALAYLFDGVVKSAFSTFIGERLWPVLSFAVPISMLFLIISLLLAIALHSFRKRSKAHGKEDAREKLAKLAEP